MSRAVSPRLAFLLTAAPHFKNVISACMHSRQRELAGALPGLAKCRRVDAWLVLHRDSSRSVLGCRVCRPLCFTVAHVMAGTGQSCRAASAPALYSVSSMHVVRRSDLPKEPFTPSFARKAGPPPPLHPTHAAGLSATFAHSRSPLSWARAAGQRTPTFRRTAGGARSLTASYF